MHRRSIFKVEIDFSWRKDALGRMALIEKERQSEIRVEQVDSAKERRAHPLLLISFAVLFSLILPREFAGPDSPSPGKIYQEVAGGFRWIDLTILVVAGMTVVARAGTGRLFKLHIPTSVTRWGGLFGLAIVISLIYSFLVGAPELFFDWRGVAVGVIFMLLLYQLLRANPRNVHTASLVLLMVLGMRAAFQLFNFLSGATTITILGQRIPVFDGPTLSNTVFLMVATGCLAFGWREGRLMARLILASTSFIAFMVVALAFRRTYWGEACVALILLLLIFNKKRWAISLTAMTAMAVLIPFLPNEFMLRVDSANPFASDRENPYTLTNDDHLDDIADAWDVVKKYPILGYGLGRPYTTSRIRNWKFVSWGVHNGPVHVWLRYGALGLVSYLGLHAAVLRWLLRLARRFNDKSFERWWILATFSYIYATFVVALFATPWAYGSTQNTLLIFGLIATALLIQRNAVQTEARDTQKQYIRTHPDAAGGSV